MTPAELLRDLASRGIQLEACGDKIRVYAAVRPDESMLDLIRAHKPALLALLNPTRTPGDEGCPKHWRHLPMLPARGKHLGGSGRYRVKLFGMWYLLRLEPTISATHVAVVDTRQKRRLFADLHELYRFAWSETYACSLNYPGHS